MTKIEDNYPKDKTVSGANGKPKDSLVYFFPTSVKRDTQIIKMEIDSFKSMWFSSSLHGAKEPLLYNFYQGHDIYRFTWLRSFSRPLIFSLNKDGSKVWLTVKALDRQPDFMDKYYTKFIPPHIHAEDSPDIITEEEVPKIDSIVKGNRKSKITLNETKNFSLDEWNKFNELIKQCNFWNLASTKYGERGTDGSEWIIEGHLKSHYWFVDRWAPNKNDNYRKCGEYLIKLSGLNEDIY